MFDVFSFIPHLSCFYYCDGISGPIPFIVVGEIFRQEPRAAAMSLSLTFNWVCNFILNLIFRFMQVRLSLQLERFWRENESLQNRCETSAVKQFVNELRF